MHQKNIITAGKKLTDAQKALILVHGRGATADDILGLREELNVDDYAIYAPQATNYTWYPYSFLAPVKQNEPWLSSAVQLLNTVVDDILKAGISHKHIYFAGFSQGACLTLEYVTRNARRWGGVAAFTGGLIGDKIYRENYAGEFAGTPVFLGSSDPDAHVPLERVRETSKLLREMEASVIEKIYPNMGHTITIDEVVVANREIFNR